MPDQAPQTIITLAELKVALSLTDATYDSLLPMLIRGVSDGVERFLNRPVMTRKVVSKKLDGDGTDTLFLPPPVQSVSSLINDTTTIAAADFLVYTDTGKILLLSDTFIDEPQKVTITYTVGWDRDNIPQDIVLAATLWSVHQFQLIQRDRIGVASKTSGDETTVYTHGMPEDVRQLLVSYRFTGFAA